MSVTEELGENRTLEDKMCDQFIRGWDASQGWVDINGEWLANTVDAARYIAFLRYRHHRYDQAPFEEEAAR